MPRDDEYHSTRADIIDNALEDEALILTKTREATLKIRVNYLSYEEHYSVVNHQID